MTARKSAPKKSAAKNAAVKSAAKKVAATKSSAKKAPQSKPYEEGKWAAAYARAKGERRYWLVKSEPDVFSFDDLLATKSKTTHWDGVRNTGARNFLRDGLKKGDLVFFYHSNAEPSAIVGICEVVREGYADESAFDAKSAYYDSASVRETPMWYVVDLRAVEKFPNQVTLAELKANAALADMSLIRVSRLAVVPVTEREWKIVKGMGGVK